MLTLLRPQWLAVSAILLGIAGPTSAHEDHLPAERAGFQADVTTAAVPWTHLDFQNDPDNFQFAIMSDRTGSPREGVFENAVKKLNWLMPEFVLSVGDLIKGNARSVAANEQEWDQFEAMVAPLKMPFFYAAGNHDIQMKWRERRVSPEQMQDAWHARFGPTHYSFVYRNVLFVTLFTNDGAERVIGDAQADYFENVLAQNPAVRWTVVLLHHPLWLYPNESGWDRIEQALAGRKHTVVAGHHHRYVHFDRQGSDYYILATTGGGSPLRGNAFGEFDHISWFTMTDDGPVMTNLRLDGILPPDVSEPASLPMVQSLESAAQIEANVIMGAAEPGRTAAVILRFANPSDYPLRLRGTFFHHHLVHPEPGEIDHVLPAHAQSAVLVKLDILRAFGSGEEQELRFFGTLTPVDAAMAELRQSVEATVPLAPGTTGIWGPGCREFVGRAEVSPRPLPEGVILRYTTDGSEPTASSPAWEGPRVVRASATWRGRLWVGDDLAGPVEPLELIAVPPGPGLFCSYYEFSGPFARPSGLPDFSMLTPIRTTRVEGIDLSGLAHRADDFGAIFFGTLHVADTGNYGFHLISEDGARLVIDGQVIVDDPIKHPREEASGFAALSAGEHAIEVQYFQANQGSHLELWLTPPTGERRLVTAESLSVEATSRPRFTQPLARNPVPENSTP